MEKKMEGKEDQEVSIAGSGIGPMGAMGLMGAMGGASEEREHLHPGGRGRDAEGMGSEMGRTGSKWM